MNTRLDFIVTESKDILQKLGTMDIPLDISDFQKLIISSDQVSEDLERRTDNLSASHHISREDAVSKLFHMYHTNARWASYGMPTFEITHSLAAMLLLTDVEDMTLSLVPFPFPTFMVKIPSNMNFEGGQDVGTLKFATIHQIIYGSTQQQVRILQAHGEGHRVLESVVLDSREAKDWIGRNKYDPNSPADRPIDEDFTELALASVKKLIINLSHWLSSSVGKTERTGKWKSSTAENDSFIGSGIPMTWLVGREIKLDKNLIAAAKESIASNSGLKSSWALQQRHVVRGHSRNQPIGPGRKEIKRIWIAPHWKGPQNSTEAWTRVYKDITNKEKS